MTRRLFPNPFSGRQAPIGLTSYFLLSPEVHLKLSGVPMSAAWKELGKESLFKSLEYHRRRGQPPSHKLCNELLELIPTDFRIREEFQDALDAARGGDDTRLNQVVARGAWAYFMEGHHKGASIEQYLYANRYVVELEAALVEPDCLLREGNFLEATRALKRAELTAPLLSPEMTFALASITSARRLGPIQWAITLETALSHLAAWIASVEEEGEHLGKGDISLLLKGAAGRCGTPGAQFYRVLKRATKQKSMMALVNHLSEKRDSPSVQIAEETLKRWSSGKTLPEQGLVKLIVKKCCPDQEKRILTLLWVARYLTLLGYVSETILTEMERLRDVPGAAELFAPWPTFPYGQSSFLSWCQQRYPFWYRYHQGRLAAGERCPAAS